jgi:hypothetical protein
MASLMSAPEISGEAVCDLLLIKHLHFAYQVSSSRSGESIRPTTVLPGRLIFGEGNIIGEGNINNGTCEQECFGKIERPMGGNRLVLRITVAVL